MVPTAAGGLNGIDSGLVRDRKETIVMAHGFGSGLGFFYSNIDPLLASDKVSRVLLFDWLGMGGSDRPPTKASPRIPLIPCCDSRFSTTQAVDFFIDSFEAWVKAQKLDNFTLVAHSLGGYAAARYALKYPGRLNNLILASPVGFPTHPTDSLNRSELDSVGLKLIDTLWSKNVTPQQLVRMMGSSRGKRSVISILGRRLQGSLTERDKEFLGEYLYHITVAPASGEYAMNSLLKPIKTPNSIGVYAREPLLDLMTTGCLPNTDLKVLFGDHDWMRPSGNELAAREVAKRLGGSVSILRNAGHHLYMDNSEDFHREILSCC